MCWNVSARIISVLLVIKPVRIAIHDQVGWEVFGKGHVGGTCVGQYVLRVRVVEGGGLYEYFGNRDCQWASRCILKDFKEDALTISGGSLFQIGTARMVKAYWLWRVA